MGGKSSIERLPEPVKKRIQQLLRENRLTLEGLVATLQTEFPEQTGLPSKSSVGRYNASIKTIVAREREISIATEALVGELGENFDSKSGALLAQAVTTLANRVAFAALERTDEDGAAAAMDISDVLDLARAAKTVQEARSLNYKERRAVADDARQKLLQQQKEKLEALGNKGGVTNEAKRAIREALGIA